MFTALAVCFLYCACFGFYHANPKRSMITAVKSSPFVGVITFWISIGLLGAALFMSAIPQGLERGIPVWFGLLNLTGALSLLVSAMAPDHHLKTAFIALGCAFLFALLCIIGDFS